MQIVCTTLWLPKQGNSSDEYEDAAASAEVEPIVDRFRCAVADGATETSFSALWAKLLVDGYVTEIPRTELKQKWLESIANKQLPWYAEQKAQSGAYAAIIGLTIQAGASGDDCLWQAEALGDSCLLLVRQGKLIESFPLNQFEQFNNSPLLVSSNLADDDQADQVLLTRAGIWESGDIFYLLTDAIARWALKRQEEHGDAISCLAGLQNQEEIAQFVDLQRTLIDNDNLPLMRNDDVTLMRVLVET